MSWYCLEDTYVCFEKAEKMMFEDLLEHEVALVKNDATTTTTGTTKTPRTGRINLGNDKNEGTIDIQSKKIMHREVERQRRQEMAGLYASLRSLLPLQYIKGKRAISDHMHEAVNYINHLQTNIKELEAKRDRLKKNSCSDHGGDGLMSSRSSSCSPSYHHVTVNPCQDGLEILISTGSNADGNFSISKVLVELLERGLKPVTLDSTRVNQKSLHKIQTQGSDRITSIDLSELQNSLSNILNFLK